MFVVTVTFTIKPEAIAAFVPLMQDNAAASLRDEPGCQRFDVCTAPDRPGDVFLYELYSDEAAFAAHLSTAHFKRFDADTAAMIADKTIRTYLLG